MAKKKSGVTLSVDVLLERWWSRFTFRTRFFAPTTAAYWGRGRGRGKFNFQRLSAFTFDTFTHREAARRVYIIHTGYFLLAHDDRDAVVNILYTKREPPGGEGGKGGPQAHAPPLFHRIKSWHSRFSYTTCIYTYMPFSASEFPPPWIPSHVLREPVHHDNPLFEGKRPGSHGFQINQTASFNALKRLLKAPQPLAFFFSFYPLGKICQGLKARLDPGDEPFISSRIFFQPSFSFLHHRK